MREYKTAPAVTTAISDRTVTGIFAVHGNIDDGDWWTRDRSHPGAFQDTAIKGRDRARFLWMHNSMDPPVAVIDTIKELSRAELPPAVLEFAPEATGGAEVTRTYLDTPRANEILAGIKAGAIQEMSYGYDIAEWKMTEDPDNDRPIREILKVRLWDISDVNWGMNPATVGAKGAPAHIFPLTMEHEAVLAAAQRYIQRLKGLAELRAKDSRPLGRDHHARGEAMIAELASAEQALRELLTTSAPPATDDAKRQQMRQLWLESQKTLAYLNGVTQL